MYPTKSGRNLPTLKVRQWTQILSFPSRSGTTNQTFCSCFQSSQTNFYHTRFLFIFFFVPLTLFAIATQFNLTWIFWSHPSKCLLSPTVSSLCFHLPFTWLNVTFGKWINIRRKTQVPFEKHKKARDKHVRIRREKTWKKSTEDKSKDHLFFSINHKQTVSQGS